MATAAVLACRTLDAALVSPGEPTPFPNVITRPDLVKGMSFNLANNIWGTNYPMWQPYGNFTSSFRFRFILEAQNTTAVVQHPPEAIQTAVNVLTV